MWCREMGAVVKYATAWRAQLPAAVVQYATAWRASLLLLPGARCSRWAWSPCGVSFMFCLCPEFEVPLRVGGVVFSHVVGEDIVLANVEPGRPGGGWAGVGPGGDGGNAKVGGGGGVFNHE